MARGQLSGAKAVNLTTAQIPAASTALKGMTVFDTTTSTLKYCTGAAWIEVVASEAAPVGQVIMFGVATAPSAKWIACDGGQYAVATYPALDALIGTTYGARTNGSGGAGSTHFRTPNFADKIPLGKSGTRAAGATGGAETHTLAAAESGVNGSGSTGNESAHTHPGPSGFSFVIGYNGGGSAYMYGPTNPWGANGYGPYNGTPSTITGAGSAHSHPLTARAADSAHNNMQPWLSIPYFIRALA